MMIVTLFVGTYILTRVPTITQTFSQKVCYETKYIKSIYIYFIRNSKQISESLRNSLVQKNIKSF